MFPEDIMKNVSPERLAKIKEMAAEVKKVLLEQGREAAGELVQKHLTELFNYHGIEVVHKVVHEEPILDRQLIGDEVNKHLQSVASEIDNQFKLNGKEAAEEFVREEINKTLKRLGLEGMMADKIVLEYNGTDNFIMPPSTTIH